MPGLDLNQLSSNWKKLQESLASSTKQPSQQNDLKRKRAVDGTEPGKGLKKSRLSNGRRKAHTGRRMGLSGSKNEREGVREIAQTRLASEHGISQRDISAAYGNKNGAQRQYVDDENGGLHPTHRTGKYVAMDCEMVGTGAPPYDDNVLARVSLVNFHGEQIYDSYVLPPPLVKVEDYRTFVSGIKPSHLVKGYARSLPEVQKDVASILDGRILVGHALQNDLQVLLLSHPKRDIRDTSRHPKFRIASRGRPPALRHLAKAELGLDIQGGEHSSVEDARATMLLFQKEKAGFDEENIKRFGRSNRSEPKSEKRSKFARSVVGSADDDIDDNDANDSALLDGEDDDNNSDMEVSVDRAIQSSTQKKKKKAKKRTKRK